jgi:hypothetical protein
MYFTLKSIPELQGLPAADRWRLWRQALNDRFRLTDIFRVLVLIWSRGVGGGRV